jgi:hypothetical protein
LIPHEFLTFAHLFHRFREPKITFPVVVPLQPEEIDIDVLTEIEKKNDLLVQLEGAYQRVLQMHQAVLKEYRSKHDHLQSVVNTKSLQHMYFLNFCKRNAF